MIDCFASEPHFIDHLYPIYNALPAEQRGAFVVRSPLYYHAEQRQLQYTNDLPAEDRPILVASYGDVKRARKMGRTHIGFIEHGIGQSYGTSHGSYAGGSDRADVSLFMVPNEYSAALWRKAYPSATVAIVGSPRLETLPERQPNIGENPTVAISFHWDCALVPETMGAGSYYRTAFPLLKERWSTIGHAHPRAILHGQLVRYYRRASLELVPDFHDVCRRADVYLCDNSSSLYEFAATGRPVVVLNAPWFRRDVHHGLRFWEAADVGIQVDSPAELPDAVAMALKDPPAIRRKREAALGLVYAYRSGASLRAATAVIDWANKETAHG